MLLTNDTASRADAYLSRMRDIVARFGGGNLIHAVFLRRPVISAFRSMLDWLRAVAEEQGSPIGLEVTRSEGAWVGVGEPPAYIAGSFQHLSNCETLSLQRLGAACVAAHNACQMCMALPRMRSIAMDARHCAGAEMQDLMGHAASVGGAAAQHEGACGFVAAATELTNHFGHNITNELVVCRRFPEMAAAGRLSARLDTHGGCFLEGLDPAESYAALERDASGTGGHLPDRWDETYATADTVEYDGAARVKAGREFLLRSPRP